MSYSIINHTKKEVIQRAFTNWELYDWTISKIIQFMRWDETDQIVMIETIGDLTLYDYYNDFMGNDPCIDHYDKMYICNISEHVLECPYDINEYKRRLNDLETH